MRSSDGAVIVYDITNDMKDSVEAVVTKILQATDDESFPTYLVGNKLDLGSQRKVSVAEGAKIAEDLKLAFMEVSAKSNTNIEELFEGIARSVLEHKIAKQKASEGNDEAKRCSLM